MSFRNIRCFLCYALLFLLALPLQAQAQDSRITSISDPVITEGDAGTTNVQFTVTCACNLAVFATVDWRLNDGSATTADNDYVDASGNFQVNGGTGVELYYVNATVNGDLAVEPDETFEVELYNASVGSPSFFIDDPIGTATIQNDDVAAVDIELTSTESVDPVIAGGSNLTYVITADNIGTLDATGVAVSATITYPAGASIVSVTPSVGTWNNTNPGTWTIGNLAVADTPPTLTVVMAAAANTAVGTGSIGITAAATSTETDSDLTNNGTNQSTSVARQADIVVGVVESIDPVVAGSGAGNLVYTVTATNNGPSDVTAAAFSNNLVLPAGVTVDSVTPSAGATGGASPNYTWTVDLASGGSETLTVTLTADSSTAVGTDVISNTASLTGSGGSETFINTGDDSAAESTSVAREVDIAVQVAESIDPVLAGSGAGNLVYTVTATNNGPSAVTAAAFSNNLVLPAGVTVDSVTPSAGATGGASPNYTWTVDLAPGGSETLTVTLTAGSSAAVGTDVISNTATLTGSGGGETFINTGDDSAVEATSVEREVDIVVGVVESIDPVVAGSGAGNLVYTVTATNNGPSDVTAAAFTNDLVLPAGVTVDSVTPSAGTTGGASPNYTWTVDIGSGGSETLTVTLTADSSTAVGTDVISNTATITGSGGGETIINTGDDSAVESTSVVREVDIVVQVAESIDPVVAGSGAGNLVYTTTVSNAGPSDVTAAAFTKDLTLPTGVTVDSAVVSTGALGGASPNYTWTVDLASGASETLTVTLTVDLTADEATDAVSAASALTGSGGSETIINTGDDSAIESTTIRWPEATFNVTKAYEEDPGPEVPMQLECTDTSGLLVYNPQGGTSPNTFVVRRFDHDPAGSGTQCTVTEQPSPGFYEVERTEDCDIDPVGDQGDYDCTITNAVTVATFAVSVEFSDGSLDEVLAEISCNGGLPLEQSFLISDGNPVYFTVMHFIQGELDCTVTVISESAGYDVGYDNGTTVSETSCEYTDVTADEYVCMVAQDALPASFTVYSVWETVNAGGELPIEQSDIVISCDREILDDMAYWDGGDMVWRLDVTLNNGDDVTVMVDTTDGPAECMAEQSDVQTSAVETTDDCEWRFIAAGGQSECTILNTVFYEGIPTLSNYGLALLVFLTMGIGAVGLRRFV